EPDQAPIDDVTAAVDDIVTTAEADRDFARKGNPTNQAVLTALAGLQAQFSALQNNPAGRVLPRTTGPATTTIKKVL
ncbi:MAG: scaffold protein, partial [Pseudomonas sp.]|nr:scaffold protein [Pseudomonas sp.]